MRLNRKAPLQRLGRFSLVFIFGALGACDTESGIPTSARISVTGSGTTPLELVVSTDFFEQIIGEGTEIGAVLVSADTLSIDLPFEQTTPLTELGSVLYRLIQADSTPSNITMTVFVNGREEFMQDAAISAGGSLEFRYLFRPR